MDTTSSVPAAKFRNALSLLEIKSYVIVAAIFSAAVNILYLAPTLYMMQVYDRVITSASVSTLVLLSIAAFLALATLSVIDWLRLRILHRASLRLDKQFAPRIMRTLLDADDMQTRGQALRELDTVRSAMSGPGALAVLDAPWTPLYLGVCFLLHPAIGLLTLSGGLWLFALAWINEKESRQRQVRSAIASTASYATQETMASQAEVIRTLGMREALVSKHLIQRRTAVSLQSEVQLISGSYSGLIKFSRLALQSGALGLSAWLVIKGEMSAGSIIASSVLLSRAVAPVEQLVGAWPSLVAARISWNFLRNLVDTNADRERPRTSLPVPQGRLQLKSISHSLTKTDFLHLRNINLELEPGQTLGIIGPSGSGKTTLLRVIAGGLKQDRGSIRLDGAEYDARDSDSLALYIGYVPQTPSLFAGTIKENIARFSSAPDQRTLDMAVIDAAKAAGVHNLIQGLPGGYDMMLGPYGTGVSAGQAQRIALARALFGSPVLLVLDEPNSNLDQEGEAALTLAISAASRRGAAVVIVAHRMSMLSNVDRLVVMSGGSIAIDGPREDVLSKIQLPMSGTPNTSQQVSA